MRAIQWMALMCVAILATGCSKPEAEKKAAPAVEKKAAVQEPAPAPVAQVKPKAPEPIEVDKVAPKDEKPAVEKTEQAEKIVKSEPQGKGGNVTGAMGKAMMSALGIGSKPKAGKAADDDAPPVFKP